MSTPIVSLEVTLRQLAHDFALRLVEAALRSPVDDLAAGLAGSPVGRVTLPIDDPPRRTRPALRTRPRRPPVKEPAPRRPAPASRRRARAAAGRERPVDRDRARESDVPPNVITDPDLLLDVIDSGVRSSRPAPRVEERAEADAEDPGASVASDTGPVLRPGERLQRTAAGNVVLRRGGK